MGAAKLQKDLDGLVDWADTWQLRFNADKCKVIHMGRSNPGYTYNTKTHETGERMLLGMTDSEKALGVLGLVAPHIDRAYLSPKWRIRI